jgi:hypothetical protein
MVNGQCQYIATGIALCFIVACKSPLPQKDGVLERMFNNSIVVEQATGAWDDDDDEQTQF